MTDRFNELVIICRETPFGRFFFNTSIKWHFWNLFPEEIFRLDFLNGAISYLRLLTEITCNLYF